MREALTALESQLLLRAGVLARSVQVANLNDGANERLDAFVRSVTSTLGLGDPARLASTLAEAELMLSAAGVAAPIDRISYFAGLSQADRDLVAVLAALRIVNEQGNPLPTGENRVIDLGFAHEVLGNKSGVEYIFEGAGALIDYGLLTWSSGKTRLDSTLRLRDHALAQLRGESSWNPDFDNVESVLTEALPAGVSFPDALGRSKFSYVRASTPGLALFRIAQIMAATGRDGARWLDLRKVGDAEEAARQIRVASLDAFANDTTLVIGPLTEFSQASPLVMRGLQDPRVSIAIFGTVPWEHAFLGHDPYCWVAPGLEEEETVSLWNSSLGTEAASEVVDGLRHLPLQPDQIRESARIISLERGEDLDGLTAEEVTDAIRVISFESLGNLARRVTPQVGWSDLLLPDNLLRQLHWLCDRYRNRLLVSRDWRLKPGGGRGIGVAALFTGESGTGKTLAAEVAAAELGLELLVVDLSSLVDKYIGETEKNLEKVFSVVENAPGILFFDEADAVFGTRSEVKESNDRFANIQVSYLLQRLEAFNGLAILSSNLKANIDQAFLRRLDMSLDFPVPDSTMRLRLWHEFLRDVPVEEDIEWDFLATHFEIAGGNIRAATVSAAYLAAGEGRKVQMRDLVIGIVLEYRKLGHLLNASEFAHWSDLVKWV